MAAAPSPAAPSPAAPSRAAPGTPAGVTPVWSMAAVEGRIVEAVDTLRRVPAPDVRRGVTRWPGFIHDAHEAYGYTPMRVRLAPAAPDAITRLDETLDWLRWLPPAAQRIAWSRASGFSWRRIAVFVGKSPNTCRAWYLAALHHLADRLNGAAARHQAATAASRRGRTGAGHRGRAGAPRPGDSIST